MLLILFNKLVHCPPITILSPVGFIIEEEDLLCDCDDAIGRRTGSVKVIVKKKKKKKTSKRRLIEEEKGGQDLNISRKKKLRSTNLF